MLAFAMMAVIDIALMTRRPKDRGCGPPESDPLVHPGNPTHRQQACPSAASSPPTSSHGHVGDARIKPPPDALISKQKCNCNASYVFPRAKTPPFPLSTRYGTRMSKEA
jgi:hypothetical protein